MIQVLPDLDDDLLVRLFHKSARRVWTSADVDWEAPVMLSDRGATALGRLLSPVYLGEQSAMIGASSIMPQLMAAGETSAQVYLSSFIYDEARHFEALTRLYRRLDVRPAGLRDIPEMLRYHHRLRQGDRIDWVWGILISDLFAKNFYGIFSHAQPDALFGKMSTEILRDESRHQAFADEYLTRAMGRISRDRRSQLLAMWDDLMRLMTAMYGRLRDDCAALEIDGDAFVRRLMADVERHARRIGLIGQPDGDPPGGPPIPGAGSEAPVAGSVGQGATAAVRRDAPVGAADAPQGGSAESCGTCYLAALCESRLVQAGAERRHRRQAA